MPAVTATNMIGAGVKAVTKVTLNGTDSFTYREPRSPILILSNDTGSPITPVIDGDGGSTVNAPGLGVVSVSSGYSVGAIADGESVAIVLSTIKEYCRGTIAITSGTGLVASLLEF